MWHESFEVLILQSDSFGRDVQPPGIIGNGARTRIGGLQQINETPEKGLARRERTRIAAHHAA